MCSNEPIAVNGVLITWDDAARVVQALSYLQSFVETQNGARLPRRFIQLREYLTRAASYAQHHVDARTPDHVLATPEDSTPDGLIDTTKAADILGCGASNVRDLCRRHTLTGYRVGGRWLVHETEVRQRAARGAPHATNRS
ncbi:helix-turn-helix domain-containing protein [Hoyosella altamirensis]|uniref:Excisionase family DNA binding protein n=1 Tax=Hoyosella altamirensis TaxID=616997 RepID=A0A839RNC4_9ACTN|nr:helix-turn-helix domain-containing protein [Hoyosella altamirensis]MBB3037431.1 excisionase family DNA binding protein [Hoyosella altamirensis]